MRLFLRITLLALLIVSCKNDKKTNENTTTEKTETQVFNDSSYVLNGDYPVGDVRRYGIFPDSLHSSGHPFTKKTRMETILDLSEQHNIEMIFPEGYYNKALIIRGRENINLKFQNAEFGGMIQIFEKDSTIANNINFKGDLVTYGGFFSRKAENLSVENLHIKSDISKSIEGLRSKGCLINAGSKNIKINTLTIDDLGSGSEKYKYVAAALSIQGWNNNPENVEIEKVHIKSTDRHGIYITGTDHLIGEVIIDKFGVGDSKFMDGMQDAVKGEEKEFKALWINKAYNGFIESVTINEQGSKAKYTAHFDAGDKTRPFTIGTFNVINDNPNITILEEDNNGVIIESQQ